MSTISSIIINGKPLTYRITAVFQYMENYGAHDWDGKGECPQRWKSKGGHGVLLADGITSEMLQDDEFYFSLCKKARTHESSDDWTQYWFSHLDIALTGSPTYRDVVNAYCDFYIDIDEQWNIVDNQEENPNAPIDKWDATAESLGYLNA